MIRILIGSVGFVALIFGLIVVWGSWIDNTSTTTGWVIAVIGAVMFIPSIPEFARHQRKRVRELKKELRK